MFRALKSFSKISFKDKMTVLEIIALLFFGRILLLLPYKYMKRFFGAYNENRDDGTVNLKECRKISRYITSVGRRLPWKCNCLVNALAAKIMLHRRGLPSTIYFGMTRGPKMELIPHAWVKCGDFLVTGRDSKNQYTTVGYFS